MMASYRIEILRSANKDVRKIDKRYIESIFNTVKSLSENPFPLNCKKIKGSESSYRIRIGDYRIIYEVESKQKMVTIYHIRHRKDAYKV